MPTDCRTRQAHTINISCYPLTSIFITAVDTPFLFSQAFALSSLRVRYLVESFGSSFTSESSDARWQIDVRLVDPRGLGALLLWGLSRILCLVGEQTRRGILEWDSYVEWKLDEEGTSHSPRPVHHICLYMIRPSSESIPRQPLHRIPRSRLPNSPTSFHYNLLHTLSLGSTLFPIKTNPTRLIQPLRPSPLRPWFNRSLSALLPSLRVLLAVEPCNGTSYPLLHPLYRSRSWKTRVYETQELDLGLSEYDCPAPKLGGTA